MNSCEILSSLSITHVQYDANDPYAKWLAIASLAPFAMLSTYMAYLFLARRDDILAIETFAGQLACEGFNSILKRLIAQPRPTWGTWHNKPLEGLILGKGHGMPSSHAQFVGFILGWAIVLSLGRLSKAAMLRKAILCTSAAAMAVVVGYSRVHLSYHTLEQVIIGEVIGFLFAFAWYAFTEGLLRSTGFWDILTDSYLGRGIRLRDFGRLSEYGPIDAEEDEYLRWRAAIKRKKA